MTVRRRIIFAGTPTFAAAHLSALLAAGHDIAAVYSQPDRPAGRGKRLQPSPVKQVALAAGLPIEQPMTLKDAAAQQTLAAYNADVMVVVAYGLLLPQAVLDTPTFGCINVHASLLPRWRGAAPIQRAIEAGDTETGITLMQMEAGLDTGPMLSKVTTPIEPNDTGGTLHDRLAALGPPALLALLASLESCTPEAQDNAAANYAHKISKIELELDWRLPASTLERKVRAFAPAPVCFARLGEQRVKIWAAEAVASSSASTPGTIDAVDGNRLVVSCAEGALSISEAQFPGGKPMTITQLLNGKRDLLVPGTRFICPSEAAA